MLNFRNALIAIALTITLVIVVMFSNSVNSVNADKPDNPSPTKPSAQPSAKPLEKSSAVIKKNEDEKFLYAMKIIIKHEGGLSDSPSDSGLITKYGISLRYLKLEKMDLNGDGVISKDDVIYLTRTEADEIYYKQWYLKYKYYQILDKIILTDIMDFSINAGATQCHKTIKRAINRIISDPIKVDGNLDKDTIEIINLLDTSVLHEAFNQEQEKFYRLLVKNNPALGTFLTGWILRSKD